ncbi:hypothetical protein BKA70DRAFT_1288050 [Coprinopsis sp. MPI-PUGE-AT-0042]|nr:hypothetical protein BKA70DRAFT_1288050 [Coprinopsis sp. MPI-PUGE-AT-0042]
MSSGYIPLDSHNDTGINEAGIYSIDASDFSSGNELMLPPESFEEEYISISTIFHPGSAVVTIPADCVVCSGDGVFFYVNAQVLSLAGPHKFPLTPMLHGWLLAPGPIAQVPESAIILNIIFCAVYGISCDATAPSVADICHSVDRMYLNGLDPVRIIQKGTPLYTLLMTRHTPYHPLMVFSTAAQHGIESLAQDASSHLLGMGLEDIDDASACRMGPLYLKRLSLLNVNRVRALKRIVLNTIPAFHTLTRRRKGCSTAIQKAMSKDWVCTVTQLTWDAKSNISPHFIRDTCYRAGEGLPCQECRTNWNDCADAIARHWAQVKFTI